MLDVVDGLLEKDADVRVVEGVDDAAPAPLADHETKMAEHAELMRDRRLLHADRLRERVHRARRLAQAGENADAAWRCEGLHRLGDLARCPVVNGAGAGSSLDAVAHGIEDSMNSCSCYHH